MVVKPWPRLFKIGGLAGVVIMSILILRSMRRLESFKGVHSNSLTEIPFFTERRDKSGPTSIKGVPLVIYESWHSSYVPPKMKENIYSLLNKNPKFDYYLYTDDDCADYIKVNFSEEVLKAFNTLKPGAYKSDLWRYCIMYKQGGVYLDIKYNTLESLEDIITRTPEVFVKDLDHGINEGVTCFYNGIMISPPGNDVFKNCIDEIVENCKKRVYNINSLDVTGPCLLGRKLLKKDLQYTDNNTYQFSREIYSGFILDYISYKEKRVFESYLEYRDEQKLTQKTEHYGKMWDDNDIYT